MTFKQSDSITSAENSLPTGIPQKLQELFDYIGLPSRQVLLDMEVARMAGRYLEQDGEPRLHWCPDTEQFASWDSEMRKWNFGKQAQEKAIIAEFIAFLRNSVVYWEETRRTFDESGKILFDPSRTPLGKLGVRYITNRGLGQLVESYKIPREHQRYSGQFDNKPEMLLLQGRTGKGLVADLRRGEIRPAKYEDMLSVQSNFRVKDGGEKVMAMIEAPIEEWYEGTKLEKVISHLFGGNKERIAYARRLMGKWMVAGNKEQTFDIFKGNTRSGKSVILDSYVELMGAYAHTLSSKILTEHGGKTAQDGYELGHLRGKRLVIASETRSGEVLNDQFIKSFTGGKFLTIRKINQDIEIAERTFNLVMDTNHLPSDIDRSGGQSTRINILWGVGATIPREGREVDLIDRIVGEESEIFLAWCMRGAKEYLTGGLRMLEESSGEAVNVKVMMSGLAKFIEERIDYGTCCQGEFIADRVLKAYYEEWCEEQGKSGRYKKTYANVKEDLVRICGARIGKKSIDGKDTRGIFGLRIKKDHESEGE